MVKDCTVVTGVLRANPCIKFDWLYVRKKNRDDVRKLARKGAFPVSQIFMCAHVRELNFNCLYECKIKYRPREEGRPST